jgi:biopolymer transport protein ExbD
MRKIKFARHYQVTSGRLDMAPLVDVVLNLLVYFMLTSSFLMQPGLQIKLPEAKTTEPAVPVPLIISIAADARIFIDEAEVGLADLPGLIARRTRGKPFEILVKGDEQARHGLVVKVMDIARLAGASRLVIATSPEL